MPQYIDPMQYLSPYFAPKLQKAMGMLPTFLAHKRGREQLAQRKEEFAVRKPYLETQAELAREKMAESAQAKKDLASLMQGGLTDFAEALPGKWSAADIVTGRKEGIFGQISLAERKAPTGFTLGPGQARYGPEGAEIAREKPKEVKPKTREIYYTHKPTGQKIKVTEGSPQDIDFGEDVNYQRGVPSKLTPIAPAKAKPPTRMQINKEISRLQTARSKILSQWNDFKATGLANDLIVMITQGKFQAGQGVPPELIEALENQYIAHIKEVDTQLTEYYRQIGRTPQTFTAPSQSDGSDKFLDDLFGAQ